MLAGVVDSTPLEVRAAVSPISKEPPDPELVAKGLAVEKAVVELRSLTSMLEAVAVEPEVLALMLHLPIRPEILPVLETVDREPLLQ